MFQPLQAGEKTQQAAGLSRGAHSGGEVSTPARHVHQMMIFLGYLTFADACADGLMCQGTYCTEIDIQILLLICMLLVISALSASFFFVS